MPSSTSGWRATPRRLRASRSTSTTPATRSTAASSCRSSTPTTMPTASCRSTSTTPRPAGPWRSCSGPAKLPPARRCAAISAASSGISARAGHRPASWLRGDSHYARPEAMDWCEANGVIYLFGLAGSEPLIAKVEETADAVRTRRAVENAEVIRDFAETTHRAKSWSRERRAIARIEATRLGLDVRFVVTNLTLKCPRTVYDTLYCARGQAENLIKAHKVRPRL